MVGSRPPDVEPDIPTLYPTQLVQPADKRRQVRLPLWIILARVHENADASQRLGLLRRCDARPAQDST
jgi:hypothetical protein